ncbi:hypothetical protein OMCYN_00235 [cyanobiont of Ornithocercus magnificus]|nr:hypothetical protein OMCYN_00235 [cyanobiont of Ornithocercus magnificus]
MTLDLQQAEIALARGEYGQCLALLEPLAEIHLLPGAKGGQIRLLMVTAWIGQGQYENALATCRLLRLCNDSELRKTARQFQLILEAPKLERPADWSLQLPLLEMDSLPGLSPRSPRSPQWSYHQVRGQNFKHPSTGPTQGTVPGFALLTAIILLALTFLLSGCVQLTTDVSLRGPDRVELNWTVIGNPPLPWVDRFITSLMQCDQSLQFQEIREGTINISSPVRRSRDAAVLLSQAGEAAITAAGLTLAPPLLELQEHNWLVGVSQKLILSADLRGLPEMPGLSLRVRIRQAGSLHSKPVIATRETDSRLWILRPGEINYMELHCWRWSLLGLGLVAVGVLLTLALVLQQLRLHLGFGYPELPS